MPEKQNVKSGWTLTNTTCVWTRCSNAIGSDVNETDEFIPEVLKAVLESEEPAFMRANNFRQSARRVLCDAGDWRRVRRAIGGRTRPKLADMNIGDQVYDCPSIGEQRKQQEVHQDGMDQE